MKKILKNLIIIFISTLGFLGLTSCSSSNNDELKEFNGITMNDYSCSYDGLSHSIKVEGELPDGTTVNYQNNDKVNVGNYSVKSTISCDGYKTLELSAILTITKKKIEGISLMNQKFTYDGKKHSLTISGTIPDGVTVTYINNEHVDLGSYEVTAIIKDTTGNYEIDKTLSAKLDIVNYIDFDNSLYDFSLNNGSITLDKYIGNDEEIIIPKNVKLNSTIYEITTIGANAFENCSSITSVKIPETVTTIEANAFEYCSSLKSIILPENITTISESTFYRCSSLTNLTIPETVTTIGRQAFEYCKSLTSIIIPETVTTIDYCAFSGCSSLIVIYCEIIDEPSEWNYAWNYESYPVVWNYGGKNGITEEGLMWALTKDNTITIYGYNGSSIYVAIPITINEYKVRTIGESAFNDCTLIKNIVIPETVTKIGSHAFDNCSSLTNIELPKNIKTIGFCAFNNCKKLESIVIPESVISLDNFIFKDCESLKIIFCEVKTKPDGWGISWNNEDIVVVWNYGGEHGITTDGFVWGLTKDKTITIAGYVGLSKNIKIPSLINGFIVSRIESYAFYLCDSLESLIILDNITEIGECIFANSSMVIFCEVKEKPEGWESNWGNYTAVVWNYGGEHGITTDGFVWGLTKDRTITIAGYNGVSKDISIPSKINDYNVATIGESAFYDHITLTNITIPNSVNKIENDAFCNCTAITSIIIPNSVLTIDGLAFMDCRSLKIIYCEAESQPRGWSFLWNYTGYGLVSVEWGYKNK